MMIFQARPFIFASTVAVAFGLPHAASAQESRRMPRLVASATPAPARDKAPTAVVQADGKVIPIVPPAREIERPGTASANPTPCPDAKAMSETEAAELVKTVATAENFYPDFVLSVAKIESRYNVVALSEKGAYGLMQLMPDTAAAYKVNLCDPADNVKGGVRLLRDLHTRYRNPFFILAAYNAGEGALQQFRGVPPYPETVRFVADVMNDFYVWPEISKATSGRRTSATLARAQLDAPLIQQPATPPPSDLSNTRTWTDGFVMHVD